jgi:hypothetical protein
MKKAIVSLLFLSLLSCNKEETPQNTALTQLTPSSATMKGKWIIRDYIKVDGSIVAEYNFCSSKRDYVLVDASTIKYYTHNSQCVSNIYYDCNYQVQNKEIIACENSIFDGDVIELTTNTMTIQYPGATGEEIKSTRFIRVSL